MGLSRGDRVGPYEVLGPLGAGGMGEVYRARDPRLGRDVAIKILPASLANDTERLRRFELEARSAGTLNHPNILAIHDIGSHQGAPYLVSELLEGESLRERIARGPLSSRKAIDFSVQIARGLSAAHAKGIVHRDLKPDNLFVTKDGYIRILDFGLAKLTGTRTRATGQTATAQLPLETVPGMVLGTAGYMSPEQVRGLEVDHRTDIFALGAILFEMLSGRRAFAGGTPADTMSAILTSEPPELVASGAGIPPGLDRIVRHCLEKDPGDRFQSAHDLEFDLLSLSVVSTTAHRPVRRLPRRILVQALVLLLTCAVVGSAAFLLGRRSGSTPAPRLQQLTFRKGYIFSGRFARDGQTIAYGAAWDAGPVRLFQTRVGSVESRDLDLPSADILAVTTTDEMALMLGRHFVRPWETSGTLARMPLAGGTPRAILEGVSDADLSLDGSAFAVIRRVDGQQRLEYPTGTVLATATGTVDTVRISPDGKRVAFLDHPIPLDDRGYVAVVERGGKARRLSTEWAGLSGLAWHPTTGELWFGATRAGENYGILAVSLEGRERSVLSVPADVRVLDISTDGKVLVARDTRKAEITCMLPGQAKERDLSWYQDDDIGGISADGRTAAFYTFGPGSGPNYAAYVGAADGSSYFRLGEGTAFGITPDGKWVLGQLPTTGNVVTLWPTGAGEPRRLELDSFESVWFGDHCSFTSDGSRVAFRGTPKGKGEGVWVLDLGSAEVHEVVGRPAASCLISPDGSRVAVLDTTGSLQLYSTSGGPLSPVPSLYQGEEPVEWKADSRTLYVWDQRFPARVFGVDVTTGQRAILREVAPADLAGIYWGRVLMTQDASTFLTRTRRLLSDLYVVEGLR